MESQLTIRLPVHLARRLERASKQLRRKRSEIVRLALEAFLEGGQAEPTRPIDRVRDLLGSVESGISDLGQRHRHYLLQRLRRDGR